MIEISAETAITHYAVAYQRLYNRKPLELRAIDRDLVVVNGARMRALELNYLTQQLLSEYEQHIVKRKSMVNRLLNWLKQ